MRGAAAAFVILAVALAGCAQAANPASTEANGGVAATTGAESMDGGTIRGVVTNDELVPIAGADVAVVALDLPVRTNEIGEFEFQNVPAGRHGLYARAPFHEARSLSVEVMLQEVTEIQIQLVPIPVLEAYAETLIERGKWECSFTAVITFWDCSMTRAYDAIRYDFDIKDAWNTTQMELVWTYSNPAQATTPGALVIVRGAEKNATSGTDYAYVYTKSSPLMFRFQPGLLWSTSDYKATEPFPSGKHHFLGYASPWGLAADETQTVATSFSGDRSYGIGASVAQPFTLYISIFYVDPPPADFVARPS